MLPMYARSVLINITEWCGNFISVKIYDLLSLFEDVMAVTP